MYCCTVVIGILGLCEQPSFGSPDATAVYAVFTHSMSSCYGLIQMEVNLEFQAKHSLSGHLIDSDSRAIIHE